MQNLDRILETRQDIKWKKDGSPVTSSDIFVENLIHEYLRQKMSEIVFIGEESCDFCKVSTDGYIAVLDPIDGTENFCSGLKEWGVSLGLWKAGSHLGSLLFMPELNERLITGDKLHYYQSRITGVSSSFGNDVLRVLEQPGEYRVLGCAVYNIYNVIRGSLKRFTNPKGVPVWDFLPGVMLALEHGCCVEVNEEKYTGKFLQPNQKYRINIQNQRCL